MDLGRRILPVSPVESTIRARGWASRGGMFGPLAAGLVVVLVIATGRTWPVAAGSPAVPQALAPTGAAAPATHLATAAGTLAGLLGTGGSGVGFFAVQRTTEYARTGGPTIAVVDPADDRKVIGQTDHLFINAMMSKGVVRPDGFFMEMHLGSQVAGAPADFAAAPAIFAVLGRDGATWRNDGVGWYATGDLPGMGFDLATAGLLPRALGRLGSLAAAGTDTVNGVAASVYTGTVAVADYPGAIASDGAAFTDPAIAVKVWLDGADRPIQLWIRARNTNQAAYDLISETTITFDYGKTADLPLPAPTMAPESPPAPDPAAPTTTP